MLRLIFWPVLAPSFLYAVGSGAMMPVLVLAALQVGASEALASALLAVAGAMALVVTVPVGAFIDRIGDKRAMATSTLFASFTLVLTIVALASPSRCSLALFVASLILRSPAMVAWNLSRQAVVAEAVPSGFRGQAMTALGGTMRAGNLVGPLLGALLLLALPLWSVFALAVVTSVAATALMYVRRLNTAFDEQTERARTSRTQEELELRVRWKAVWFAGVAITTLACARVAQPIIVALWGVHLGWSEAQISFIVAVGAAIELVFMVPGGRLKDRLGRSTILTTCLLVYGSGFLLLPLWATSPGFVVAMVVMSVGNGLGAGINMTIGADLSPAVGRARFLSIWAMFTQGAQLGAPLAISGLLLAASLPAAVGFVGGLALVGALWTTLTAPVTRLPRAVRREETHAAAG